MGNKDLLKMIVDITESSLSQAELIKEIVRGCRGIQDQVDQLYKRVQALEKKEPGTPVDVPLYEELLEMDWEKAGIEANRIDINVLHKIRIAGKPLNDYTKWELAQIIKRLSEIVDNIT